MRQELKRFNKPFLFGVVGQVGSLVGAFLVGKSTRAFQSGSWPFTNFVTVLLLMMSIGAMAFLLRNNSQRGRALREAARQQLLEERRRTIGG